MGGKNDLGEVADCVVSVLITYVCNHNCVRQAIYASIGKLLL